MMKLQQELQEIKALLGLQAAYSKPVFSVSEAAGFMDLSEAAIYKLIGARKILCSRPNGKKVYIQRAECERFMLSNPIRTAEDIQAEAIVRNGRKGGRWQA